DEGDLVVAGQLRIDVDALQVARDDGTVFHAANAKRNVKRIGDGTGTDGESRRGHAFIAARPFLHGWPDTAIPSDEGPRSRIGPRGGRPSRDRSRSHGPRRADGGAGSRSQAPGPGSSGRAG